MAESTTIARPYAQAVFQLALENHSLTEWSNRLQRLALIAQDAEMSEVVKSPKFSAKQVVDLFVSLSGEPDNQELISFIALLAENERFDVLAEIRDTYEELKNANEGIKEALIVSAYPIDEAQLKPLVQRLEAHFGSHLRPRVEVDTSLIGGVKVFVGDQVLDASVRGKLDAMAATLKN